MPREPDKDGYLDQAALFLYEMSEEIAELIEDEAITRRTGLMLIKSIGQSIVQMTGYAFGEYNGELKAAEVKRRVLALQEKVSKGNIMLMAVGDHGVPKSKVN